MNKFYLFFILVLTSCTLRDFGEQTVLREYFNENIFSSKFHLITPISQNIETTDTIDLKFCIKDKKRIKSITINTPHDKIVYNLSTNSPQISQIKQTIHISNFNNIPDPTTGNYPIDIQYKNMNNEILSTNFIFKVKVKSPHFTVTYPQQINNGNWGNESVDINPNLQGGLTTGAQIKEVRLTGVDSKQTSTEFPKNNIKITPNTSIKLSLKDMYSTAPTTPIKFTLIVIADTGAEITNKFTIK